MRALISRYLTGRNVAMGASAAILFLWVADLFKLLPGVVSQTLSLAFGILIFIFGLIVVDRRLRARGKNGWWLILFFGPAAMSIFAMSFIPPTNQKALLLSVILTFCFCSPFALWGLVELSAKARPGKNDRY